MKLCYLGNIDNIHTRRWVSHFAGKGHETYLLGDRPYSSGIEGVTIITPEMNFPTKVVAFKLFPRPFGNNVFKALPYRREVRRIKPDLVHGFEALGYGFVLAHCGPYPKVLTPWGNDVYDWPKRSRLARWLVRRALKRADAISTNHPALAPYLAREFGIPHDKVTCFSWGVDLTIFKEGYREDVAALRQRLGISADAPVMVSNRQMNAYWGIEEIVRAVPHVVREIPAVVFVFLRGSGSAEYERAMERLAEKEGVARNVRFVGEFLGPRAMAVFLNLAHVFVSVPYTDLLSISVLEGMACGAIPVLSELDAYKTRVKDGENGFYVPVRDSAAIAERIIYCLKHPELKERMGKRNREIISAQDNWETNAQAMETLYEQLVERRRS
jgi:glycosyltransferase involved in cell wall biosynthesis